jgi:OFA family oxalate/formate antiporter-like MFS transporter
LNERTDELRRGWLLILAACAGVTCSSVVLPFYSIGVLVKPLTEEFGWTRAQFQSSILFSASLGALIAPVVGWLIYKYGTRRTALVGLFGLSLGFVLASAIQGQLWMLYLAYGTMAVLGAGTSPVTWTSAITANFDRTRGIALGLTLTGTGICAVLAPQYGVWLVESFGWRVAYLGLALLPILFAGPIVYFGFRPDGSAGAKARPVADASWGLTLGEAFRSYKFWILFVSILCVYMAVSGISPNLIPALTDNGMSAHDAATVQGMYGIAIVVGRLVVGYLIDRFWAPAVAAVALCLPVVGCIMLAGTPSFHVASFAALLIGFAAGAELDLMSFLTARYFGLKHYAKIYAVLYAVLAICSGVAPVAFATVFDRTASYDFGFYVASAVFAVGALILLSLGPYPRREWRQHNDPFLAATEN